MNDPCPCGSNQPYPTCCGPYINQKRPAPTPEALMRSRYTAYSLADMDYIQRSMKGKPLQHFDAVAGARWASKVIWLDLRILEHRMIDTEHGHVTFLARFIEHQRVHYLQENSEFRREQGQWFYVDGVLAERPPEKQPVSRHSPCPCGSQKKFKNCHARER